MSGYSRARVSPLLGYLTAVLLLLAASTPARADANAPHWDWLARAQAKQDIHLRVAESFRTELESFLPQDFLTSSVLDRDLFVSLLTRGAYELDANKAMELRSELSALRGEPGRLVAQLMRRLGTGYEKIGQFLGNRPDLVAEAYRNDLALLSDSGSPLDQSTMRMQIARSLQRNARIRRLARVGDPQDDNYLTSKQRDRLIDVVFDNIESEPLGTGSVAQAHLATLKSGEAVVIKVVKPWARRSLNRNFAGFEEVVADGRYRALRDLLREVKRQTLRETDLRHEAVALRRAGRSLARRKVFVPTVAKDLSDEDILLMELAPGVKITDAQASPRARRNAAHKLFNTTAYLAFLTREFHGDPHEGNALADVKGPALDRAELSLLDFGLTGRLKVGEKIGLVYLLAALTKGSTRSQVKALAPWTRNVPHERLLALVGRHQQSDKSVLGRAQDLLLDLQLEGAVVPPNVVAASKALLQAEGVAYKLDPDFTPERALRSLWRTALGTRLLPRRGRSPSIDRILDVAEARLAEESASRDAELIDSALRTVTSIKLPEPAAHDGRIRSQYGGRHDVASALRVANKELVQLDSLFEKIESSADESARTKSSRQAANKAARKKLRIYALALRREVLLQAEALESNAFFYRQDRDELCDGSQRRAVEDKLGELGGDPGVIVASAPDPRLEQVRRELVKGHGALADDWRQKADRAIEFAQGSVESARNMVDNYPTAYHRDLPAPIASALESLTEAWDGAVAVEEKILRSPLAGSKRRLNQVRGQRALALRLELGFLRRGSQSTREGQRLDKRFGAVKDRVRQTRRPLFVRDKNKRARGAVKRIGRGQRR